MKKISVDRGKVIQIIAAASANLLSILFGFVLGWTSPAIIFLQSEDSPLESGPISINDASLMTSLLSVGAVLGCVFAGWLANAVGRKISLQILILPQLCAFILIATAKTVTYLHISRVLSGFSAGACVVVFPIFISEIADKSLRSVIGNFLGLGFNFGCLVGKILTSYAGYYATPIVAIVIIGSFLAIFTYLPDTPQYFLLRNREEAAQNSLKFYRGVHRKEQMTQKVAEEFAELKASPSLTNQKISLSRDDFKGASTFLAIVITFVLSANQNFTGSRILIAYTQSLFRESGSRMDEAAMDLTVTVIQVITAIACIPIIKMFGSRNPLLWFYLISGIFLMIAGIHYNLHENGVDMSDYAWLIIISFAVSIAIPGTGIVSISFVLPTEILPPKIRGSVISGLLLFSWILAIVLVQFYFQLAEFWGHSVWMYIFSIWCLLNVIFSYFFIPETKGKNFDEVVVLLNERVPRKFKKNMPVSKDITS
ncbi:facilitated trehalose transporter Tret1-like [Phlebotomus papatasi]|uniref:facilitated trehalose transporter Tret1-like n=1 Tax=Phlebotomus papatasi TaxID=29031 RepID=UPI002483FF96|nr:facilitated trehalose transporter Tret1-like [Phlebotomus papatasi]